MVSLAKVLMMFALASGAVYLLSRLWRVLPAGAKKSIAKIPSHFDGVFAKLWGVAGLMLAGIFLVTLALKNMAPEYYSESIGRDWPTQTLFVLGAVIGSAIFSQKGAPRVLGFFILVLSVLWPLAEPLASSGTSWKLLRFEEPSPGPGSRVIRVGTKDYTVIRGVPGTSTFWVHTDPTACIEVVPNGNRTAAEIVCPDLEHKRLIPSEERPLTLKGVEPAKCQKPMRALYSLEFRSLTGKTERITVTQSKGHTPSPPCS